MKDKDAGKDARAPGHDPIALALIQNRLDHISRQMGWVMTRTARSPIFNQSHDFSCFIAAADGTLISQADGIPIHTGGGGFVYTRCIFLDIGDIGCQVSHRRSCLPGKGVLHDEKLCDRE